MAKKYKYVNDLWKDSEVKKLDPANRLIYRSNKLGSDQRITNTGGGNTSANSADRSAHGRKGGGAMGERLWRRPAHVQEGEFCLALSGEIDRAAKRLREEEKRGPKTPAEDEMVGMYPHCTFNLNPRASSIDPPLHSFVPGKHVTTHPNAPIAICAAKNSKNHQRSLRRGHFGRRGCVRASSSASPCNLRKIPGQGRDARPTRPDQLG